MSPQRPLCLLIGALGGQGGGLLLEWLAGAARIAGYPAQGTSIPGVAQRTGATTYYFELFPDPQAGDDVVFSLFPGEGEVDLVATLEPTEATRALQSGWITTDTTVVTTTGRVYSTSEKALAGDGRIDPLPLLAALADATGRPPHLIDPDASTLPLNARLLGAIAASGILPLAPETLRQAVVETGVAVEHNLAGFDDGLVRQSAPMPSAGEPDLLPPPAGFETDLAPFPPQLHPLLGHALARLVDYQDTAYARLFLQRLHPLLAVSRDDTGLLRETARQLARWMCLEDVIRVAQLKTRPGRLQRIRRELGAADNEPVTVRDYFRPRLVELTALLPAGIGPAPRPGRGLALRWPTSSPVGYALLKGAAALRPLRRAGRGFRREQRAIEHWLEAVTGIAGQDPALALETARLAVWVRGYGAAREHGLAELEHLLGDWEKRLEQDASGLAAALRSSLERALTDPDPCTTGADTP